MQIAGNRSKPVDSNPAPSNSTMATAINTNNPIGQNTPIANNAKAISNIYDIDDNDELPPLPPLPEAPFAQPQPMPAEPEGLKIEHDTANNISSVSSANNANGTNQTENNGGANTAKPKRRRRSRGNRNKAANNKPASNNGQGQGDCSQSGQGYYRHGRGDPPTLIY